MLSAVMFGMSGDGGQQPVAPVNVSPQESLQVTLQGDNAGTTEQKESVKESGTEKDQFGIDTGMTKDELEKFKEDYLKYQEKNKIHTGERAYYTKINILELDKFKKFNINLNALLDACSINDYVVRSELIIIGSYDGFEIDPDKKSTFPVTYKIKVDEVLSNETEYGSIPTTIVMKGDNIYNHSIESLSELLKKEHSKNRRYVMFLTRYDFYYFKKSYEEKRRTTYVKDDCFDPYVFTYLSFARREIKDNKIAKDPYKSDFDEDNWLELDDLKRNIKEISKINDRENFYIRSYK